ncbi:hypothetical protein Cni_G26236 [Canna indica]|uniref:NPH3 domain-containing protein n=1 Tax=Canna indica TaxID=4628 RepID=A0AAQ3QN69_9LILI|nr:hypothetical protein Cni_G26236 [Canna indica]
MDCRRLTLEACTHATQNERLPLQAVVQVLFFEQLQLRRVIAGTLLMAEGGRRRLPLQRRWLQVAGRAAKSRVQELERECSSLKKALAKLDEGDDGEGAAGEEEEERQRQRRRDERFGV